MYRIWLKSLKQIPRYGFSPKSGRCNAHCLISNAAPIKSALTIPVLKFNDSGVFRALYQFICFWIMAFCGRGSGPITPICNTNRLTVSRNMCTKLHKDISIFNQVTACTDRRTDGQTGGQTDGRTDRRADGRTDGRTENK